jgi:hypothetical protein
MHSWTQLERERGALKRLTRHLDAAQNHCFAALDEAQRGSFGSSHGFDFLPPRRRDRSSRELELERLIRRVGFKEAALRHHPDRGGRHEDMVIINALRARQKVPARGTVMPV